MYTQVSTTKLGNWVPGSLWLQQHERKILGRVVTRECEIVGAGIYMYENDPTQGSVKLTAKNKTFFYPQTRY